MADAGCERQAKNRVYNGSKEIHVFDEIGMDTSTLNVIAGAILSLVAIVVGAVLNSRLSVWREERTEQRQQRQERIATVGKLYEDGLYSLRILWRQMAQRSEQGLTMSTLPDEEKECHRYLVKLGLHSTPDITAQYSETFQAILGLFQPQARNPRDDDRNSQEEIREVWTIATDKLAHLERQMTEHLEFLRNEDNSRH